MKESALKWLYDIPGGKKLYIVLLTVAEALNGASGVLFALLLREVVDAAVEGNSAGFRRFLILIILLAAAQLALRALIRWLNELSKSDFENIFKHRLMDAVMHKDFLRVSAVHSGEWLNRLTSDTVVVANGYVDIIPGATGMLVKLLCAVVMIIVLEPVFAAILIPGGILMLLLTWLFRRILKNLHKSIQEADGHLRVFLQERIGSLMMIRSFSAEAQTSKEADDRMKDHKSARMRRMRFSNMANVGFSAAMSGMYILGIGWCGYGILRGTISFGTLTAITQLISQIHAPFANISGYLPKFYAMIASAERLMEAEAFEDDLPPAGTLSEALDFYNEELAAIGLADVDFTYCTVSDGMDGFTKYDRPVVLNNLSFEISKGSYTAFTGHSGCGKSTVLKLMMCVYKPDDGTRYYRDISGKTGELTSEHRRLFAYVPQGNQLMNGTIREIVSFADPAAAYDEQRLSEALTVACADGFVGELEDGVDTLLGERGAGLSEGQMQRIAIARAVFSGSPILLLDESTSALDAKTEKQLLEKLRSMTNKTVVIVTHRSAALSICDKVFEFTENEVFENGSR